MNQIFEVHLHKSDSFYVIANSRYQALEVLGDYLENNKMSHLLVEGNFTVHEMDMNEEKVLARGTKCFECET
ncbi:MAG TPA: hypothetical protein VGB26_07955 [Nitrospiria bacterium]|jgi:hypothetical protein